MTVKKLRSIWEGLKNHTMALGTSKVTSSKNGTYYTGKFEVYGNDIERMEQVISELEEGGIK